MKVLNLSIFIKSILYFLKKEDIEKYNNDIETAYYNREQFTLKLFMISIVWTMIITLVVHLLSSNSIYINNIKSLDLKDKKNWVEVSQTSCKNSGGVFSKEENECRAKWIDAKKSVEPIIQDLPHLMNMQMPTY